MVQTTNLTGSENCSGTKNLGRKTYGFESRSPHQKPLSNEGLLFCKFLPEGGP